MFPRHLRQRINRVQHFLQQFVRLAHHRLQAFNGTGLLGKSVVERRRATLKSAVDGGPNLFGRRDRAQLFLMPIHAVFEPR